MTLWMLWSAVVGGLVGACALLVERVLLSRGLAARRAWVAGVVATGALQLWPWIRRPPPEGETSAIAWDGALPLLGAAGPVDVTTGPLAGVADVASRIDPVAALVWPVASILLLGLLAVGVLRVRRASRTWPRHRTAHGEILVSPDFGPAVVGLLTPAIVMPAWAFRLDDDLFRAAVLHEAEHRSARDTLVVFSAAIVVALTPWNPALWWMLTRLRHAVEVDCDQRVLGSGVSRARYGGLLVELSTRVRPLPIPATALGRPASLLERRVTMIVRPVRSRLLPHAAALAGLGVLLLAVACEAPAPTELRPAADPTAEAASDVTPVSPRAQEAQELARGVSLRNGEPLVVVDGERTALTLDELEPARVRRIEVLKGEAATRHYGPEGAAGVVQVWTSEAPTDPTLGSVVDGYEPAEDRGRGLVVEAHGDDEEASKRVQFRGLPDGVELYVDGERFEGELADLDPDRIDRIEVVKGEGGGQVFITLK